MDVSPPWRFAYDPPILRSGRGCVSTVGEELDRRDLERVLVVCGRTVGTVPGIMDPIGGALGDRLVGVFAETTPAKRFATAVDGAAHFRDTDADAIVGLGGGSSLDIARFVAVIAGSSSHPDELRSQLLESGGIDVAQPLPPVILVPTTLAGAELSRGAGITVSVDGTDDAIGTGMSHPGMRPCAVIADPDLTATTPPPILRNAALNGFNKGIESLYSRRATPVTDATATRGIALLREHLPRLAAPDLSGDALDPIVAGSLLVQYGISRPEGSTLSIIHAFGHAVSRTYPVQQGVAHAVVTPHVLRYLFDRVDGRRDLLAAALGHADATDRAAVVVESVTALRDELELPARLRDVDGPSQDDFSSVAKDVLDDRFMANAPPELDPSTAEVRDILSQAY